MLRTLIVARPRRRVRPRASSTSSSASANTSRTSSTRWNVMTSRTASGTSSRSGPLRFGRITVSSPARWAASTFCLTPPIGSTRPCSVTSPVMPTPARTARPVSKLTNAVVIVMPADGPSLGIAPAGTWRWKRRCVRSGSMPNSVACARTYDSAICADSFITSPSCPVSISPSPSIVLASMNSTSPPEPVTAKPVATPGVDVRSATSAKNFGLPSAGTIASSSIATGGVASPDATRAAVLRSSLPSSRSRFLTPASRV